MSGSVWGDFAEETFIVAPLLCLRHNASSPNWGQVRLDRGRSPYKYVKPDETGTQHSETNIRSTEQ